MKPTDLCSGCGLPIWACDVMTELRKEACDAERYDLMWKITEALRKARPAIPPEAEATPRARCSAAVFAGG
jgi:hypothetical protein